MSFYRCVGVLFVTAFLVPAAAEEIVHFSNGTAMAIESHTAADGMLHVELADNASMAFPEYMVDRITAAGKNVTLGKSSSNRMVKGSRKSTNNKKARGKRVIDDGRGSTSAAAVQVDDNGLAVYRPFRHSKNANKRQIGAVGAGAVITQQQQRRTNSEGQNIGTLGTTQIGSRKVIGDIAPPGRKGRPAPVGLTAAPRRKGKGPR